MIFTKEKILSPGQLKRLGDHKYSYSSTSLLDSVLQPWWNWLTSKLPLWLAPNLITVSGLIVNVVTSLILVWYSPDAKQEVRRFFFNVFFGRKGISVNRVLCFCCGQFSVGSVQTRSFFDLIPE